MATTAMSRPTKLNPSETKSAFVGDSTMYLTSSSYCWSCHHVARLSPSKATEPSITETKATVPGCESPEARPESGGRTKALRRPSSSRTVNAEIRARRPK